MCLVEGAELFFGGHFKAVKRQFRKPVRPDWKTVKRQSRKPIKPDACGPCGWWKALNFSGFWGRFKAVKRQFRKPVRPDWKPVKRQSRKPYNRMPVAHVAAGKRCKEFEAFEGWQTAGSDALTREGYVQASGLPVEGFRGLRRLKRL